MNAISLFTGVGMFDLGFASAGFNIVAQVEIDSFCRKVLKRHAPTYWPHAKQFVDVTDFGRHSISGSIDVIYGGFPCQPHSLAGQRQGESDHRNMWPEFRRIIGEFRPGAVMLENVAGITQASTVEGEIRPAYALTIITDLAALGYDSKWGIISAADAGAPHQRDRWWCAAYANGKRSQQPAAEQNASVDSNRNSSARQRDRRTKLYAPVPSRQTVGNTCCSRRKKQYIPSFTKQSRHPNRRPHAQRHYNRRLKSRMGRATDGLAYRLDAPRWPARQGETQHAYEAPYAVSEAPYRPKRIKALGNGGLPQIAYAFAQGIKEALR